MPCWTCRPTSQSGLLRPSRPFADASATTCSSPAAAVYRPSAELPWRESDAVRTEPDLGAGTARRRLRRNGCSGLSTPMDRFAVTSFGSPLFLAPQTSPTVSPSCSRGWRPDARSSFQAAGTSLNQFVFAEDVARALVVALERPDVTGGEAYNCAYGARSPTTDGSSSARTLQASTPKSCRSMKRNLESVGHGRPHRHRVPLPLRALPPRWDEARARPRCCDDEREQANARGVLRLVGNASGPHPRRYAREDRALAALGLT